MRLIRIFVGTLAGIAIAAAIADPARANDDAHRMAQIFAVEAEKSGTAEATATAAAEAGKAAAAKQRAEAKRREAETKAAEARRREDARRAAERRDADRRRTDEADMLARARAEAEERLAEMQRAEDEARVAEREAAEAEQRAAAAATAERMAREEDARRLAAREDEERQKRQQTEVAEAARLAEIARLQAEDAAREREIALAEQRARDEQTRDEEARRLAEKLERVRASREMAAAPPPDERPLTVLPPAALASVAPSGRVAILLAMTPGDRGIRRTEKTGDPVLCLACRCYIGAGADQDARAVSRWGALGTFNTLGKRAGACSHALTCVFRNVDLGGAEAAIQPIDLRILRHDRREERVVRADPTCAASEGRLTCRQPVVAPDYRLWIVPEPVAAIAGSAALQAAVREWLPDAVSAGGR